MAKERTYTWYVWTDDAHTNEVIARSIADPSSFCSELELSGMESPQSAWKCDHMFITALRKSAKTLNLKFTVFVQDGRGPIRLWTVPVHVRPLIQVPEKPQRVA